VGLDTLIDDLSPTVPSSPAGLFLGGYARPSETLASLANGVTSSTRNPAPRALPVRHAIPKKKAPAAKLRSWRVSILRNQAEFLGVVPAADELAAEKAAIEAFALDEDRRRRLAVRED
jgi:hypothetical protein